jgi:hypothetical protein
MCGGNTSFSTARDPAAAARCRFKACNPSAAPSCTATPRPESPRHPQRRQRLEATFGLTPKPLSGVRSSGTCAATYDREQPIFRSGVGDRRGKGRSRLEKNLICFGSRGSGRRGLRPERRVEGGAATGQEIHSGSDTGEQIGGGSARSHLKAEEAPLDLRKGRPLRRVGAPAVPHQHSDLCIHPPPKKHAAISCSQECTGLVSLAAFTSTVWQHRDLCARGTTLPRAAAAARRCREPPGATKPRKSHLSRLWRQGRGPARASVPRAAFSRSRRGASLRASAE